MLAAACILLAWVPPHQPLQCGWMADAKDIQSWPPIQMENRPEVYRGRTGVVWMRLPQVPQGWPYAFQWSGLTQDAIVDLGRFPILVARVSRVTDKSYAHMDIEESDVFGKPAWGARSSTLQQVGLSIADLGKDHPGVRRLHLRLIVGGPNSGAAVAYSYVRFIRREDLDFLTQHPEWNNVVRVH